MITPSTDAHEGRLGSTGDPTPPAQQVRLGLFPAPVRFGLRSRVPDPACGVGRHDLVQHRAEYGPRPDATRAGGPALIDRLEQAGLTGHGGGHFPVAAKWRAVRSAGVGAVVVANGAEGEPASAKDAALIQLRPHLILDGLALAAETIGTRRAVIWMHAGDRAAHLALDRAIAERRRESPLDVAFSVASGPDHYLTGESSAVVRGLSGGPALPYLSRQHAAVSGIGGQPTLVHNVETLARVALVARAATRPAAGLAGPLVTVVGPGRRAVIAAAAGETFAEAVVRSGVVAEPPAAVLVGGYGGSWLPWPAVAGVPLDDPAMRGLGASLGAGVVAPLSAGRCGLAETARVLAFLADSSARQCGPCVFGLPALAELFDRLVAGRCSRGDLRRLDRYAAQVAGRGACHHPDGAVRLVRSALSTFAADVRRHLTDGPCAGASAEPLLPVPQAN